MGGLIIHHGLIMQITISVLYLYKNFELKRGWAYNTSWAYNMYYTVHVDSMVGKGLNNQCCG